MSWYGRAQVPLPLVFPETSQLRDVLRSKLRWSGKRDMIRIKEILLPEHIVLGLDAKTREEAVHAVAKTLRGDSRIS